MPEKCKGDSDLLDQKQEKRERLKLAEVRAEAEKDNCLVSKVGQWPNTGYRVIFMWLPFAVPLLKPIEHMGINTRTIRPDIHCRNLTEVKSVLERCRELKKSLGITEGAEDADA